MWQRNLQDAWHHGKRAIGNAFNHAVKWAGQIDHFMGVGKSTGHYSPQFKIWADLI